MNKNSYRKLNKNMVIDYYKNHTLAECGKKFHCHGLTIKRRLIQWGIKSRTKSEAIKLMLNTTKRGKELRKIRSKNMKILRKQGLMGIQKGYKRSEENKKKIRETMKKKFAMGYKGGFQKGNKYSSGFKNKHWKGGISSPYWKQRVIAHYGAKCDICGWKDVPEVLQAHHRDYDRSNNTIENGQILCPNCHQIIHFKERGFK